MKTKICTAMISLFLTVSAFAADQTAPHQCANEAIVKAKALLTFHNDGDATRTYVEEAVTVLAPLKNPVNNKQLFDVLEVRGYIYKGNYRMRMIYGRVKGLCALMGQEILELASL